MRFIGLDVHRDWCDVAIYEDGKVRSAGRITTEPDQLALQELRPPTCSRRSSLDWPRPCSGTSSAALGASLPLIVEELAIEHYLDAVPAGMRDTSQVDLEVDRAHDPVAELLVDERLSAGPYTCTIS